MMTAKIDKNKLKNILKRALLTQKELAEKAGITPYFLNRIASKSGKYKASTQTCRKILNAIGHNIMFEDIFYWVD